MTCDQIKDLRKSLEKDEELERRNLLKDHNIKHRDLRLKLIEECRLSGHNYSVLPRQPGKFYSDKFPMMCRYCHNRVEYDRVNLTYENQE
jgi:hypothetical protein